MAYGHTTLSTPDLVRSRKLSSVGHGKYLDGRPPGNTRCCKLFFFSKRSRTIVPFSVGGSSSSSSACLPAPFESVPGVQALVSRVSVPFVEGGSSACLPSLRVCPVSRHLSGSSEDGESPSEDGQSHSAESTSSLLFPVVSHLQQQVQQQLEA